MAILFVVGMIIALYTDYITQGVFIAVQIIFISSIVLYWSVIRPPHRKLFKIKENRHRSILRPGLFYKMKEMNGWAMFYESSKYPSKGNVQLAEQINKLIGFSRGHHHDCSFRIGWKYSDVNQLFHLYSYSYAPNLTERDEKFLGSVACLQEFKWRIKLTDYDTNSYRVVFCIDKTEKASLIIPKKEVGNWSYCLYPWFGGKASAPQDIMINLGVTSFKSKLIG